jgi:hypothetical protein
MPADLSKTEAELRAGAIDRLIAASLREGGPAREASLENWRRLGAPPHFRSDAAGKA